MKRLPFSLPMVRAFRAGLKTQTRRAQSNPDCGPMVCGSMEDDMTTQDLALFARVCLSPAIVAVGMVCAGIALTRGVIR